MRNWLSRQAPNLQCVGSNPTPAPHHKDKMFSGEKDLCPMAKELNG